MYRLIALIIIFATSSAIGASKTPAMEKVVSEVQFTDDMDMENMLKAIDRQLVYFSNANIKTKFKFGKRELKRAHLETSIIRFRELTIETIACLKVSSRDACYDNLSQKINSEFEIYRPLPLEWENGYSEKKTLFTAYYSPDFEGSKTKTDVYKNPIYKKPSSAKLQNLTSDQINYTNALKNKGLELFYVKESLYDIWLLHVEGGGRVKVKQNDGSYKKYYLSFNGTNKKSFAMLFRYMLDKGMLQKGETSIDKQRAYFEAHPEHQREILASSPSFIWFKITEDEPLGVHNIPLTSNRSLATDYRRMQEYGVINFVQYSKVGDENPEKNISFSGFYLNQDTGGAIKGNARSDIYFGYGKNAEKAANHVHGLGTQYFLILK